MEDTGGGGTKGIGGSTYGRITKGGLVGLYWRGGRRCWRWLVGYLGLVWN